MVWRAQDLAQAVLAEGALIPTRELSGDLLSSDNYRVASSVGHAIHAIRTNAASTERAKRTCRIVELFSIKPMFSGYFRRVSMHGLSSYA